MKTSRFSDAQIIAILKQAESGSPVPESYRNLSYRNLPRTGCGFITMSGPIWRWAATRRNSAWHRPHDLYF
ncbi:hypothetical protein D3M52_01235 [Klebsiella pneumoniae]|nr:hypothetical protein [Klebsiella pneumoniae]